MPAKKTEDSLTDLKHINIPIIKSKKRREREKGTENVFEKK